MAVSALAALLCAGAVSRVADRYEASARVYVDTQTVLKPLMTGLTFQPDIDQQVRMLARTLISRPNVEQLLKTPTLAAAAPADGVSREQLITRLMDQIKVVPSGVGNLYQISYRGDTPQGAQRLVEATVAMFVNAGAGAKKRDSEEAGRFIEDQIRRYEDKLVEAENRLKDFKVRNFGVSGVSNQDYFARMSALSDEVSKLRLALDAAEQSRAALRRELAGEDPLLPPDPAARSSSPATADIEARLEAQKKQLDDLLRRYTDQHPDVVSARRTITQLETELQVQRETERRLGADAPQRPRGDQSGVPEDPRLAGGERGAGGGVARADWDGNRRASRRCARPPAGCRRSRPNTPSSTATTTSCARTTTRWSRGASRPRSASSSTSRRSWRSSG
jgi:polysaccharide chain length determinant protein (PEP-CTERM system associated)